jgi:hypothetical protein
MNQENQPGIDINSADEATLTELQGVGRRLAKRIIQARPFDSIDDLRRVRGISERDVERLRPSLTISGVTDPLEEIKAEVEPEEPDDTEEPEEEEEKDEETMVADQPPEEEPLPDIPEAIPGDEIKVDETDEIEEAEQPDAVEDVDEEADELASVEDQEVEMDTEVDAELIEEPLAEESAAQPSYITRGGACSLILIGGFFTLILAVALTLGILSSINQGQLSYASPANVASLQTQAEVLSAQTQTLAGDIDGLRARIDNLESLTSQVSEIETEVDGLQENLTEIQATMASNQADYDALVAEYDGLVAQLEDIDAEIQALSSQGTRSESFLQGLRTLMEELFPQEPEVEETP